MLNYDKVTRDLCNPRLPCLIMLNKWVKSNKCTHYLLEFY